MEQTFPGVQVYIACKDYVSHLFKGYERTVTKTQLDNNKNDYAYIRELNCDMTSHPVENFMKESDIPFGPLNIQVKTPTRCVILTNGTLPTKHLSMKQIQSAKLRAEMKGFIPEINGEIDPHTWVIGVESRHFYEAAIAGNPVTLMPTGIGENLFKLMIPHGEILDIAA